ncbi:MAG: ATP-dependent Lon protease, partial [Candidatus Krumholzibacteriia bacterium]
DPEQNSTFSDHYLEVDFDLSNVMFITTANSLNTIPAALEDRLEIIRIPGYLEHEKIAIAEEFLAPRQITRHGLKKWKGGFKSSVFHAIIDGHTREAGVRNLERELASICRKVAKHHAEEGKFPPAVTAGNLQKYLGVPKFRRKLVDREPEVGLVVGLAWTMVGGEILEIEVAAVPGRGKIMITGNLKEVMTESAETALSYARVVCRETSSTWFKENQIHLHVPEGGIPKDGPSAGIAMATAIISLLRDVPVRSDVAMTGEVTLRGRVLPIGGLPEKAVAAIRAGSKHLIIPKDNEKDYLELASVIREELQVHMVETMDEVLELALVGGETKKVHGRRRVKPASKPAAPTAQADGN